MAAIKDEKQYLKALEKYWKNMESTRPIYPDKDTGYLAQEIQEYKSVMIAKRITKIIFVFVLEIISSILMAIAVIWCINNVLKFEVPYTFRTVVVITILFFIGRTRLKYTGMLR